MRLIRWVLVVTLGEAVGISVPAAVGVAVTGASWGPLATLVAMVLAGSVEGAMLGGAQADCLYRWRLLPARRWLIVATSVGAAVAWSLGMLPNTFKFALDCRCGRSRRADVTYVPAIGLVFRAS
jgi:hypothetical protein